MNNDVSLFSSLIQYLISPAIMGGVVVWGFAKVLKLGEIKQDFATIKQDVGELKTKVQSVINNMTVIKTHLVEKAGLSAALFQSMSPISLTPKGKMIVKEIGFDVFVKENIDTISIPFMKDSSNTLLQLDEISEVVVNDLFAQGKLPGYDNEAFKRGISIEVLLRACALYLREYMAKKLGVKL